MKIDLQTVTTLQEFYALMAKTREIRLEIVAQYLEGTKSDAGAIASLQKAVELLEAVPTTPAGSEVGIDENRKIAIDLGYEIAELHKDILFLTDGEAAFDRYLRELHPALDEQVGLGLDLLSPINFRNLITDRDGTVNNYCGRYLSSIQSAYNSVFISRFAKTCVQNTVILTSAPLENGGMVDITTIPKGIVINAGSKGREYRDLNFERGTLAIDGGQQEKLDELNSRLVDILKQPRYEKFGLIGSALQLKFGQTTIARQDVTKSVPADESTHFLGVLEELVKDVDPEEQHFRIEDTGLDVEIILTVPTGGSGEGLSDFSKGNGVGFLDQQLGLNLAEGPNLVCGDTGSDVPMVEECLRHSADTWSVFVTKNEELRERVASLTERVLFVDEPDTLVSILNGLARDR